MTRARGVARTILAVLFALFLAMYVAAKIHFFTKYDPLNVGGYLREHRYYWLAMAGIALFVWLLEKLIPKDSR